MLEMRDEIIFVFELIGTVAFALSGAITAREEGLDLFGFLSLGVITATFGGVFRDLVLGITPPSAFTDPVYVITALISTLVLFLILYILRGKNKKYTTQKWYDQTLLIMDSLGLGIFTVMGTMKAYNMYGDNSFLCLFCGLITGIGGGVLRDILVNRVSEIFTKHIYAMASWIGACFTLWLVRNNMYDAAMWTGTAAVVLIRLLAVHYQWNLPNIKREEKQ